MGIGDFLRDLLAGPVAAAVTFNKYDFLIEKAYVEIAGREYWYNIKATEINVYNKDVQQLTAKEKVTFILRMMWDIDAWQKQGRNYTAGSSKKRDIRKAFVNQLFKTPLVLDDDDIIALTKAMVDYRGAIYLGILDWPIKNFVAQIQKKYNDAGMPPIVENGLKSLQVAIAENKSEYHQKEAAKLVEHIGAVLFATGKNENIVKPTFFLGEDEFATYANNFIKALAEAEKTYWYQLVAFCQKASGSKPSKKFLDDGMAIINQLGEDKFQNVISNWFSFVIKLKEIVIESQYGNTFTFITSVNSECLKGFVWLCANFNNPDLLQLVAALAERVYRKIPGVGQTSTIIGNACVFALYKSDSLEGIGHLSRLNLRVKQTSTQTLIQKYMLAAARERGTSVAEIEDLSIDDFGLADGERHFELEGYQAVIKIEKVGKVNLSWYKSDGALQKSDPALVKERQPDLLKKIKDIVKQIETGLSTQRDRLDFSFRTGRKLTRYHFNTYYFNHGLVSAIARKLIWRFEHNGQLTDAFYFGGHWINGAGKEVQPDEQAAISLWHPATDTLENVRQWRNFLISNEIQQPLKQAFREIYLLTDAELNTRSYSNRMAGHILKQHQFNQLAKARNWKYALQGAFDGGTDSIARLALPEHQLFAEYWVEAIGNQNEINATGIFNYVSTDQVRFRTLTTNAPVDLVMVPMVVLSEVMRDVDLFVGVASVGNDPNWRDNGGMPAYRDYWQSYAFGDLNEVSKNRKEILERLLPRLKIAKVAEIRDKFLIVKGKKRVYKIHIGSTNILMEPNDQYLCIVPDRSQKNVTENVFLPFEGDSGLSVIISKAFLLADDDKITDVTITRQIGG